MPATTSATTTHTDRTLFLLDFMNVPLLDEKRRRRGSDGGGEAGTRAVGVGAGGAALLSAAADAGASCAPSGEMHGGDRNRGEQTRKIAVDTGAIYRTRVHRPACADVNATRRLCVNRSG